MARGSVSQGGKERAQGVTGQEQENERDSQEQQELQQRLPDGQRVRRNQLTLDIATGGSVLRTPCPLWFRFGQVRSSR